VKLGLTRGQPFGDGKNFSSWILKLDEILVELSGFKFAPRQRGEYYILRWEERRDE
jgi:hypothetical protein